MSIFKNKNTLNVMIFIASLILLGTAFVACQRYQTQKNYELLADIRAEQEESKPKADLNNESALDKTNSESMTYQATSEIDQYAYKPNENTKWLAINPDYFGWIRVAGTTIDYPFVRSHDNKDYLTLDFNGAYSDAGTLFMDYRNLGNFNDQHTIIYGHYMKNQTLFHNLTLYHEKAYYEKNQIIEIAGLYETKTYKIFSVYEISADDYAFTLDFDDEIAYKGYLDTLIKQSLHTPDFEIDVAKKLLSLVTCSYGVNNGRTIVHAVEL